MTAIGNAPNRTMRSMVTLARCSRLALGFGLWTLYRRQAQRRLIPAAAGASPYVAGDEDETRRIRKNGSARSPERLSISESGNWPSIPEGLCE